MQWYEWDKFKTDYFTKCTSAYDSERTLFQVVTEEEHNKFAIPSTYYPISINKDMVFGEGNNKVVTRKFDFMLKTENGELPYEGRQASTMGVLSPDLFNGHISIRNFDFVSTFDSFGTSGVYPSYVPLIGDLIYLKYNGKFYRVLMVKLETEMFLSSKHTYTLVLEMAKDLNYTMSNEIIASGDVINSMSSGTTSKDMFAINDYVEGVKKDIVYEPKDGECDVNDPFNDWTK